MYTESFVKHYELEKKISHFMHVRFTIITSCLISYNSISTILKSYFTL